MLPSSTDREPPKKIVPPVPAKLPARSIGDVAHAFPGAYFSRWSEPSSDAIKYFSSVYAEKVNFYGTDLPLAVVIEQKRNFAQRWPIRVYSVRPKSLLVDCQESNCKLTGVVDWDARTTSGTERTAGAATFSFGVHVSGETVKINAEFGAVIQRLSPAP